MTQFVAGGADESDLELLTTTSWLMKNVRLKRAYFSAFHPIRDTPLENKPAVDPLRERPVEVNRAERSQLLRVPGIGLRGAEAILSARRSGKLRDLTSLRKLGIVVARAAPFLLLDGKRPASQLTMF
ncbi:MAG: hypothetical protein Kow0070_05810 [Anaerolineales bacterium]